MTILLALNAIAILVAGVLISNAIWGTAGQVHVVDEKTDVVENEVAAEQALKLVHDSVIPA